MTSFLTDEDCTRITRVVYEVFDNTTTGNGNPRLPDGMFAAGIIQGYQDLGLHGTEAEIRSILTHLKQWYPNQARYEAVFAEYGVESKQLQEYLRLLTGKRTLFQAGRHPRRNRRYPKHRKSRNPHPHANDVPFPSQQHGSNATLAVPQQGRRTGRPTRIRKSFVPAGQIPPGGLLEHSFPGSGTYRSRVDPDVLNIRNPIRTRPVLPEEPAKTVEEKEPHGS